MTVGGTVGGGATRCGVSGSDSWCLAKARGMRGSSMLFINAISMHLNHKVNYCRRHSSTYVSYTIVLLTLDLLPLYVFTFYNFFDNHNLDPVSALAPWRVSGGSAYSTELQQGLVHLSQPQTTEGNSTTQSLMSQRENKYIVHTSNGR